VAWHYFRHPLDAGHGRASNPKGLSHKPKPSLTAHVGVLSDQ
jgi:hypothetical protein